MGQSNYNREDFLNLTFVIYTDFCLHVLILVNIEKNNRYLTQSPKYYLCLWSVAIINLYSRHSVYCERAETEETVEHLAPSTMHDLKEILLVNSPD